MAEALTPKQRSAIARATQKPELRQILFRKAVGVHWFKAFEEAGFLDPADIPPPEPAKKEGYVDIPFWPVTEYLVATSDQLNAPGNEYFARRFLGFIRAATRHAIEQGFSNYRVWWQFSKVVRNIPPQLIELDDLALFDYWLDDKYERGLVAENLGEHWLVELLDRKNEHCNKLAESFLAVLFEVKLIDKSIGDRTQQKAMLRYDSWHARKIVQNAGAKVGQVLRSRALEIFRVSLEKILGLGDKDRWSPLWRPAIEDHEQNQRSDDAEDILVEGMRNALLAFVSEAPIEARDYVEHLLDGGFETIRRIAIYSIDQRFVQLGELVPQVLTASHFKSTFRHEMWHLLKNHYRQFSGEERAKVLEMIDSLVEVDEDGRKNDGATAYKRAIWLKAIHNYGNDESRLYQECVGKVGGEPEHPDFSSYMTSGWVDHKSPIPKDDLLSMEVDELVARLGSYRDPGKFREPGLEGLTKALRQILKASPTRYFGQLHKFVGLDLPFVHEVIEAYSELWTEEAQLPWEEIWQNLLAFCEEIVRQDKFWIEGGSRKSNAFVANKHWVVGSIGRLIENGTKSDEHAFSERYLDRAQRILLVLLEKEAGEEFSIEGDAVSIAINSPRGRCIEAFFNLSLRSCRLADKQERSRAEVWAMLAPSYDAELKRADRGEYEFATLVVNYLPQFLYMSKEWVLRNLGTIFDPANYQRWLCAMEGYAYVNVVYQEIYGHLKERGHFIRALDDKNIKERVVEKIVQNIAIGFVNGYEDLDDQGSLIVKLLLRQDQEEISQLIWFMWSLRKGEDVKVTKKVFELWPRLLAAIDISSSKGKKLASKLATWTVFIDHIDGTNKPLILHAVEYAEGDYNSHDLLEMIARASKTQPREAYEIWLKLLVNSCTDFPEEAVRTALEAFAHSGAEGIRQAKDIVSAYLRGGNERPSLWLKEMTGSSVSLDKI